MEKGRERGKESERKKTERQSQRGADNEREEFR
jgi:hypothetical protein